MYNATLTADQERLVDLYVKAYPHLATLARAAKNGCVQSTRALGDATARLSYPMGVDGIDALAIAKIGAFEGYED